MNTRIAIVTHHYVRDTEDRQGSRIGGYSIGISEFVKQLDYFRERYSIISPDLFIRHIKYNSGLPENAMLLTFDDGYIDHYENVFPILMERGLKAFFFPSAKPVFENRMLNTNKLQLILDIKDKALLYDETLKAAREIFTGSTLQLLEELGHINNPEEKDNKLSSYLEWEIPISSANQIIDILFRRLISTNEKELCKRFYMNLEQLLHMKKNGMHIGCHGYNHYCMCYLAEKAKAAEVNKSLKLMRLINGSLRDWIMCYPYGAFDGSLISIIKNNGCIAGLTTVDKVAELSDDGIYTLPRVDITSSSL